MKLIIIVFLLFSISCQSQTSWRKKIAPKENTGENQQIPHILLYWKKIAFSVECFMIL